MRKYCAIFLLIIAMLFLTPTVYAAQQVSNDDEGFEELTYAFKFEKDGRLGENSNYEWTLKVGTELKKYTFESQNGKASVIPDTPIPEGANSILVEDEIGVDQELDESSIRFSVPIYAATTTGKMSTRYIDYDITDSFLKEDQLTDETYTEFIERIASITERDNIFGAYGVYDNAGVKTLIVYIRQIPGDSIQVDFTDELLSSITSEFGLSWDLNEEQLEYTISGNAGIVAGVHVDFSTTYTLCESMHWNDASYSENNGEYTTVASLGIESGKCPENTLDIRIVNYDDAGFPIEGSQYELYSFIEQEVTTISINGKTRWTTDETGVVIIEDVPLGVYVVEQVYIPDGYEQLEKNITIYILVLETLVDLAFINNAVITIDGTKAWLDAENRYGLRPELIELKVFATVGSTITEVLDFDITWTMSSQDSFWVFQITNLYKYQNSNEITYSIEEVSVDYYIATYGGIGYNITNSLIPITEVIGTVTWDDEDDIDKLRPETIALTLIDDDGAVDAFLTWTMDGSIWTYTFIIPGYNGTGLDVDAPDVIGYTLSKDNLDLTYTHVPEIINDIDDEPVVTDIPVEPENIEESIELIEPEVLLVSEEPQEPQEILPSLGQSQYLLGHPFIVLGIGVLMYERKRKA